MNSRLQLIGQRFCRLVVVEDAGRQGKRSLWRCRCDCGGERLATGTKLREGQIKSCGCMRREGNSKTHGLSTTPEYAVWVCMMHRCYNPKRSDYQHYGGRGIRVCARWKKFENFYADMAPRPPGWTLERRDNNKGYNTNNCCWADRKTQARNRRNAARVTYAGKTATLAEWAEETGVVYGTLSWRRQQGWSDAAVITGER